MSTAIKKILKILEDISEITDPLGEKLFGKPDKTNRKKKKKEPKHANVEKKY